MIFLLNKTIENIANLRHFYDIQKKYIDKKSKDGIKKNRLGYLMDFYFSVLVNGTEKEKQHETFLNLQKVLENHIIVQEVTAKSVVYTIKDSSPQYKINVANSAKEYEKYAEMPFIHGNNTLVMLITRFEEFISEFIKILYTKYPKKYLDNQTITFSDIQKYGAENIQNKIIEREVDNIMRDSYTTKVQYVLMRLFLHIYAMCITMMILLHTFGIILIRLLLTKYILLLLILRINLQQTMYCY